MAADTSRLLFLAAAERAMVLDIDSTIKPLYGHQEGARSVTTRASLDIPPLLPHVPDSERGWCWKSTCSLATNTRRSTARPAVVVAASASAQLLAGAGAGDVAWGVEPVMSRAEQEGLAYISACG